MSEYSSYFDFVTKYAVPIILIGIVFTVLGIGYWLGK
jgi:hypothetical protein